MNTESRTINGLSLPDNMIIDTHAHYDDEKFDEDRDALLSSFEANGIGCAINMGTNLWTSEASIRLANTHGSILAAVGVHPEEIGDLPADFTARLSALAQNERVVMIGEIGLDYYWDKEHKNEQKQIFAEQLKLAAALDLPVSIHSRDAAEETFDVLSKEVAAAKAQGQKLTGVIHCFSYSSEMAESFIKLGFLLGIGGVCTFRNSKKLKETIEKVPLSCLVLETDSPYLAPEPYRGRRNSSLYLPHVVQRIAELKGVSEDTVIKATTENAKRILGL